MCYTFLVRLANTRSHIIKSNNSYQTYCIIKFKNVKQNQISFYITNFKI